MLKYSNNMLTFTLFPLLSAIILYYNNIFISLEFPLMYLSSFILSVSIMLDWVSLMFLTTVLWISSMIITFSMYYIPKKEHKQFILLLMMFILSMSILIMSDNIILILVGWDGLGLSSYILVIYYQNHLSAASGSITLLSNRIGDIMILLTISIMLMNSNWTFATNKEYTLITLLMLIIAASSKSAQFPFSAWLPAAMAAPTPISALVHSSTLVTAGVFLMIRVMNNSHPTSMFMLMIISSATALFSGMAANWEQDMKKIIALSTLSQIAMMMFAISMNSTLLAFFHLITHALFKSTMFLCAGITIHSSTYQDMRMMGTNLYNTPLTHSILGLSSMALMGIPFMSGFFSKDSIIELMLNSFITSSLSIMMILSIGLTASYSLRLSTMSNSHFYKSKPDSTTHNTNMASIPITIMAPFSISLGSLMLWIINPQQMFFLTYQMKMSIIMSLTMGILVGTLLSFKSHKFNKTGNSSISLWFIHILSAYPMTLTSPLMLSLSKNDMSWQEIYGPQGTFSSMKPFIKLPNLINLSFMFTLIMMVMLPLIMQ